MKLIRTMLVMLGVTALAGQPACSKNGAESGGAPAASRPVEATGQGGPLSQEARALLAAVPADATGIVVVDLPGPMWDTLLSGFPLGLGSERRKALDDEMRAFTSGQLGVDFFQVKAAVLAVNPVSERGCSFISGVTGQLKSATETYAGARVARVDSNVLVAHRGEVLVVGPEDSVRGCVDALTGKGTTMKSADPDFHNWVSELADGYGLAVAVNGAALAALGVPVPDLERAGAAFRRSGIRARLSGPESTLKMLAGQLKTGLLMGVRQLEIQKDAAKGAGGDPVEAAGLILAYHLASQVADSFEPRIENGTLAIDVSASLGEPALMISFAGMAAAVGIPAFMKYIKKSKASEASVLLENIAQGAQAHLAEKGSLPPSAGPTPPLGSCCEQGGKCAPNPARWSSPTWQALGFSIDDAHYYSYQFIANGTAFTARAYGDLDCDGEMSTFEIAGSEAAGLGVLYRENDLE